jgi:hypothetical protein
MKRAVAILVMLCLLPAAAFADIDKSFRPVEDELIEDVIDEGRKAVFEMRQPVAAEPVVIAEEGGSSWWMWVLGVVLVGGIAAAAAGGGGEENGGGGTGSVTGNW